MNEIDIDSQCHEPRRSVQVTKLEVTDLIRAAAAQDPLRENEQYKRLLEMTWDEYNESKEVLPGGRGPIEE